MANAVVTGSNTGIGQATAVTLARAEQWAQSGARSGAAWVAYVRQNFGLNVSL